ncbi:hypothetical protein ODQ17_14155 [Acinetobacter sp. IRS14]|jgi:hypothetical protein|uniref:Uncharacterized protein n=2 Tax=Acinetobacter oleivorans TaxID=1148157 RepID=A0AAN0UD32_ACISD|nr:MULTISPECIES: hypothetical protein [Acinetobacter]ADI90688.1 hypothetical protein AOLE_08995 [Acinetobacter oleivorans DR1]ENX44679.1 hypothetical protein F886_02458 [Acinetobacter sp. NIPH 542]ESK45444.1 hypothetical protein P254_01055 [Acinetobacter oleivorans CIP 110421]MBE2166171.1 hypothetical protein [Acinetobacter oleivorans]MBE2170784.1 hypothetical protein [Acinetobacter oleivorans]
MSGFKSFSQNTTNHANIIKSQMNKHPATPPTETQPSEVPGTVKDLPENNEQPDPNNK